MSHHIKRQLKMAVRFLSPVLLPQIKHPQMPEQLQNGYHRQSKDSKTKGTCITMCSAIMQCLILQRAFNKYCTAKNQLKISMITEHELPCNSLKTPKAMWVPFICHTVLMPGEPRFPPPSYPSLPPRGALRTRLQLLPIAFTLHSKESWQHL